jgi:iron(III) transport system permease protein
VPLGLPALLTALPRLLLYGLSGLGAVFVVALVIYPSLTLIWNSASADGAFTLQHYADTLTASALNTLGRTLLVSLAATLGATSLGVLLAWLMERVSLPLRRLWETLLIIPYLIPPFIGAIAWVYLLGPVGYVNRFWMQLTGTREPLFVIYGPVGIVLVMILYSYPIAYLVVRAPIRQISGALEEAARMSGARPWQVLRHITLPLLLPNIGAAALLVFMAAMSNFGIPAVIGFPARYFVLTNEIYQIILNFGRPYNLQLAAALSMQLVGVSLLGLWMLQRLQARASFVTVTGKASPALPLEIGRWRWAALGLVLLVIVVAVAAPLLAILATAISRAPGVPLTWETATLNHFQTVFTGIPKVGRAITNSLILATSAATLIMLLSLPLAGVIVRARLPGRTLLDALINLPYALPGTVVALAMILAFIQPLPILNVVLYNTPWILLVAYVSSFLAFGVRAVSAALRSLDPALEEAARISGADALRAFRDVAVPLLRGSLVAAWFLAFMPALTELTLSALLFSVGSETIGQVVFGLYQEGRFNLTAALAFSITLGVLLLSALINRLTGARAAP